MAENYSFDFESILKAHEKVKANNFLKYNDPEDKGTQLIKNILNIFIENGVNVNTALKILMDMMILFNEERL